MMAGRNPEHVAASVSELCRAGYRSKKAQCWRKATEKIIPERPRVEVCAEHMRAMLLSSELNEMRTDLDIAQKWIASEVDGPVETPFQHHAWEMRQKMEAEYWSRYLEAKTAERIASFGPDKAESITPEAAGEFTELLERTHALEAAVTLLEDAPEEIFAARDRWQIVGGLMAVRDELEEEVSRTKERIGL